MIRSLLLFALLAHTAPAQGEVSLCFTKSFPGSKPEFYKIDLTAAGNVEYREAPDEEPPLKFQLREAETAAIFELARKLDRLGRPLESGLKVARMGEKKYAWIEGGARREQTFNYSLDPDAQALQEWVERVAEAAVLFYDLERTVKYDRLGTYKMLLKIEASWDKRRLAGHALFLPLLDRVAKSTSYMNMARERAEYLAEVFRNPEAHVEKTSP
ncbi:MAG: hypothetical protein KJZ84_03700 [Bryobacteraceae bacterium]|nr:hypothetical protein [Bryobacteraceae bacterium]